MGILRQKHSGQVALIMVLIMTVVSAVAISIASRSTVETGVQRLESESTEAMFAAQAGLEKAAVSESNVTGSLDSGRSYSVTVDVEGSSGVLSDKMNPGETLDINLVGAATLTGARIYWKPAVESETPSIFVSDIRNTATFDYAYDTTGTNGFTKVNSGGSLNGVNFTYVIPSPINVVAGSSKSLRITILGAAAFVGVQPIGGQFPAQLRNYKSVGDVGVGDTKVKYGIEYKESATDQVPSVFDYALFATGSIIQ